MILSDPLFGGVEAWEYTICVCVCIRKKQERNSTPYFTTDVAVLYIEIIYLNKKGLKLIPELCEIPEQEMKENDKNNITNYLINTINNHYITYNSKDNQVFLQISNATIFSKCYR